MKYIIRRSNKGTDEIMKLIATGNAVHDVYVEKARQWISGHDVGKVLKGKIQYRQLELVVENDEGFFELFTVSLDSGSTVSVRGGRRSLMAEDY